MLRSLVIQNIVLIQSLQIQFKAGFCVLTGETGAGKSILLDSLGLVLGSRAESRMLRFGATQGMVVAEFEIDRLPNLKALLVENGVEPENTLLLKRIIYTDGKSKAFIQDMPASLQLMQQVSEQLVEICGQHDQRGLLNSASHRQMLDAYSGFDMVHIERLFSNWQGAKSQYEALVQVVRNADQDEEYLRHILKELNELNPEMGEEERLNNERVRLMNKEKILEAIQGATHELTRKSDVSQSLRSAGRILEKNASHGGFESPISALDRAYLEIEEALESLQKLLAEYENEANPLEQVEERLFALRALARKCQCAVDALPDYRKQIATQLDQVANSEVALKKAEVQVIEARAHYLKAANQLTEARKKAAEKLELSIAKELKPLKMEASEVKVSIEPLDEAQWNASGTDRVQFLVRTNHGAAFGPMAKIASGGELSRFMLALKLVLSEVKSAPTLIFDEIDTGIGGAVADAVGRRLAKLSERYQVMAVTHQPQVAALGATHLLVEKKKTKDETSTYIQPLSGEARREELARMLAGADITNEARAAAERLML